MSYATEWEARGERYGYTRKTDNRCPRVLAGKRHKYPECWCRSRLNDHAATWTRHGRTLVLWEPYQAYPEELARVTAAAELDGLRVCVHGMSPWNPGSTLAVEFTREADR